MKLAEETCESSSSLTRLSNEEVINLAKETPQWASQGNSIKREFKFDDFQESIDFVNEVADLAQTQDHHPDICVYYNKVVLELSTHKVGGLSKNDFILAAKIDNIAGASSEQ